MERAQASGVHVTVMNHVEHILNLPHVRGTCVELHTLPACPLSKKWDPLTTGKKKEKELQIWLCILHIKAGLSLRNWFIGFPDILVVVVMLYLWGNCWSLSLCAPNLFYILLWPLVFSRPLRQLLLKKRKRYISIKIYMFIANIVIYFTVFSCLGRAAFQSVVNSAKKPDANIFITPIFYYVQPFHLCVH